MDSKKITKEDINEKTPERPKDMGYGGREHPEAAGTDDDDDH